MISGIRIGWLTAAVVVGLMVASLAGLPELPYRNALQPAFAVGGTFAVVALAILTEKVKFASAVQFLGRHALEIYLVHTVASGGMRIALVKFVGRIRPRDTSRARDLGRPLS